jgi:hypothetical protein
VELAPRELDDRLPQRPLFLAELEIHREIECERSRPPPTFVA